MRPPAPPAVPRPSCGAERAACSRSRSRIFGEELDVGGVGGARLLTTSAPLLHDPQRRDDEEVDDQGRQQERDDRVDETRVVEDDAAHHERPGEFATAGEHLDQRFEECTRERGDDGRERRSDDDGDREIDHVPAEQEILESLEHDDGLRVGAELRARG